MRRPLRVLQFITSFALGGAQDYLITLLKGLDRAKFDPIVAGAMKGEWVDEIRNQTNTPCVDIKALDREISPLRDVWAIKQFYDLCVELSPDIVHTHSSKAGVVGRIGGSFAHVKAIVHTVHGFPFHDFMPSWKRALYVGIEREMARHTLALIHVAHRNSDLARQFGIHAPLFNEAIYYGVNDQPFRERFRRSEILAELGLKKDHFVIGFTGRFHEAKGLDILLEAFAVVRKTRQRARLVLVGDGPLKAALMKRIENLDLNGSVVMTGFRRDIPRLLSSMDLFVMTSRWEGLSRSLIEAMYAKLPIIATDVGGTSEAVRNNETGFLIPANDIRATAKAIDYVIENYSRALTFAVAANRWAKKTFDVKLMSRKINDLYLRLVGIPE